MVACRKIPLCLYCKYLFVKVIMVFGLLSHGCAYGTKHVIRTMNSMAVLYLEVLIGSLVASLHSLLVCMVLMLIKRKIQFSARNSILRIYGRI